MWKKATIISLLAIMPWFGVHADHHGSKNLGMVDVIPFTLETGKTLDDFMGLRERFGKTLRDLDADYQAWVWTPLFVDQTATGIAEKFDAIWVGVSPSAADFAKDHAGYLKKGKAMERSFGQVRRNLQRTLMNTEVIYRGPLNPEEPDVVMLRSCTPKANITIQQAVSVSRKIAENRAEKGSKGSRFLWHSGFGASQANAGKWLTLLAFPDLEAWGQAMTDYRMGKFADTELQMRALMTCGSPRVYLSERY